MTDSMHAVRYHELGDEEVLEDETAPVPEPAADEVLLRVEAAGVNPIDWKTRDPENVGLGQNVRNANEDVPFPITPGWDVSGSVEALGEDVSSWEEGEEVYGMLRFPTLAGTYAEYVTAPADEIARKPSSLSHSEAAAVPMVSLTAWQALFDAADVSDGDRVLVHAAAGGVGHMAVQFAIERDAHVIGTASESNEAYLRNLGVDEFVNYREENFEEVLDSVDVVIDPVGGETLTKSFDVLTDGGVLVSLLREPEQDKADQYNVDGELVFVEPNAEYLDQIRALIDDGDVSPYIRETLPLEEAAEAHRLVEKGHGRGKVVLTVN
ncbi:NADP-dependent oxidoreductase [Halomicrococcus sp. NG-SE-24]|uniref:NADP-dependent oxidoreductase n=1 Tax=Halomicrococcus sp. NG-SE-24 TaxID=3436928 RepID=UPI003D972F5D